MDRYSQDDFFLGLQEDDDGGNVVDHFFLRFPSLDALLLQSEAGVRRRRTSAHNLDRLLQKKFQNKTKLI